MRFTALKSLFFFLRPANRPEKDQNSLPQITENSRLGDLLAHYPDFAAFLSTRFGIEHRKLNSKQSLRSFVRSFHLPPAQILFMEFQLTQRTKVETVTPRQLRKELTSEKDLLLLDARESWEYEWGTLPGSKALNAELLSELVEKWPRDIPVRVYCHYGIRSLDAAIFLADHGFHQVRALAGGLEAWSEQADPTFPRYAGQPC